MLKGESGPAKSVGSASTPLRTRPHLELTCALLPQLPRSTYLPVLGPLLADRAGNTPRARSMGLRGHLRRHDGGRALWRLQAESPSASSFCSLEIQKTLSTRIEPVTECNPPAACRSRLMPCRCSASPDGSTRSTCSACSTTASSCSSFTVRWHCIWCRRGRVPRASRHGGRKPRSRGAGFSERS